MALKIRERNGKWWLFVDRHGQRKKKCIGRKEAAEHAKIPLEAKLAFGADVIPPHPGGLPITFLWLPSLVR